MLSLQLLSYALCAFHCTLSTAADDSTRRLLQFPPNSNSAAPGGPELVEINGQWYYLVPPPGTPGSTSPPPILPPFAPIQTTQVAPNPQATTAATPAVIPAQITGVYGQQCPQVNGGGQCMGLQTITTDLMAPNTPGNVACSKPGDCCQCGSILCGDPMHMSTACSSLSVSGDNAAFGVQDVQIYGNGTGQVLCSGTDSCRNAKIIASDIVLLSCTGRYACQDAEIIVNEPALDMVIECGVTSSCENLQLTLNFGSAAASNACADPPLFELGEIKCIGVNACRNMTLTVNNYDCKAVVIDMVECRQGSCDGSLWNFYGLSPVGISSCSLPSTALPPNSGLTRCFTDLKMLSCSQQNSCMGHVRTIIDPQTDFKLDCVNSMACFSAQFSIQITAATNANPVEHLSVYCNGEMACQNMTLDIISEALNTVFVSVYCSGMGACDNAMITGSADVYIEVKCGNPDECAACAYNGQPCMMY